MLLFAALTKLHSDPSPKTLPSNYLKKIEDCNLGIFQEESDLYISPLYSSSLDTNGHSHRGGGLSDNDYHLEKITHSRIDDHSIFYSKQEMSEISSKKSTISYSQFSKQRLRPPAIKISKNKINFESKSAILKK